jgi:hypothetical protein
MVVIASPVAGRGNLNRGVYGLLRPATLLLAAKGAPRNDTSERLPFGYLTKYISLLYFYIACYPKIVKEDTMSSIPEWHHSSPQSLRKALMNKDNCIKISEEERQRLLKLSDENLEREMNQHIGLNRFFMEE